MVVEPVGPVVVLDVEDGEVWLVVPPVGIDSPPVVPVVSPGIVIFGVPLSPVAPEVPAVLMVSVEVYSILFAFKLLIVEDAS
ncbi:hypothetical protein J6W20_00530 [bacterium]|nr:hypothetical protein [bacterium]